MKNVKDFQLRRRAASKERVEAKKELDQERILEMNRALEASHTVLSVIEAEYAAIQRKLDVKDQADMAVLQAALLVAHAEEYTRSVLASAPAQLRSIGRETILKHARGMLVLFAGKNAPQVNLPKMEGATTSPGGIILLGDS